MRGELLSLRIKSNIDYLKSSVPRPASGLPVNALPGWADVPLYEKLPMLDCPNNQIVFTNSEIGRGLSRYSSEYDTTCGNEVNVYNSLNDPHLRNFYSRKRNLDLLKKLGIITKDNYVICNLYEFNVYRRFLNRFHLFAIHNELKKREQDQQDKAMITHAENILKDEYDKKVSNAEYRDPKYVRKIKDKKYQAKQDRYKLNLKNIEGTVEKMNKTKELKTMILKQKSYLHNVAIEKRQMIANDIQRKTIIALKKSFTTKDNRSKIHQKTYTENRKKSTTELKTVRWNERLDGRIRRHERNIKLLINAEKEKQKNIEEREQKSKRQWQHIANSIAQKTIVKNLNQKSFENKKRIVKKLQKHLRPSQNQVSDSNTSDKKSKFSFTKMSSKAIRDAVNTAIDIEEDQCNIRYGSIYTAAKYIIEQILSKIDYDLNDNKERLDLVSLKIDEFFKYAKSDVVNKTMHALRSTENLKQSNTKYQETNLNAGLIGSQTETSPLSKTTVSFAKFAPIIGISSLQDYGGFCSITNIKSVKTRSPTPLGSLTSITGFLVDQAMKHNTVSKETFLCNANQEEQIFIEHFLVKFKREFLVGVGKRVFNEINCHLNNKTYVVQTELLEMDRQYLIKTMAKSILGYGVNQYNFHANLRLCISALSSDIICELQKTVLKPIRDPRVKVKPRSRCCCKSGMGIMTLIC